jgi:formylglycine-generating enzyme required for sulfatase activity
MGSNASDTQASDAERPQHELSLSVFRMSRYPVTNAEWLLFSEHRPTAAPRFVHDQRFNRSDQPVVGVTWYDAIEYTNWLSKRLGYRVMLPTEAQWEKAGRGCDGRLYPSGNRLLPGSIRAQVADSDHGPWPVGRHADQASPYGVEDLVGNTYAWTVSRWGPSDDGPTFIYPYNAHDGRECLDSSDFRIVRGGAWRFPVRNARCAYRGKDRPGDAFDNLGVRLVCDP